MNTPIKTELLVKHFTQSPIHSKWDCFDYNVEPDDGRAFYIMRLYKDTAVDDNIYNVHFSHDNGVFFPHMVDITTMEELQAILDALKIPLQILTSNS